MLTVFEFMAIGALWGGSFLFMRVAGPSFGPIPLIGLRVTIAGLFLLPFCFYQQKIQALRFHWRKTWIMGLTSTALPFCLLAYTTIKTNAGFGAILNSTAPFFTALFGAFWLKDRLGWSRVLGLVIGFFGVFLVVSSKVSFDFSDKVSTTLAALSATALYGFSVNYTKKYLHDVEPLIITAISQISAALFLLPFVIWFWPERSVPLKAWVSVAMLGVASTSLAFILFYRLLEKIGATKAIVVTFLIPVFGMLWGAVLLGEIVTLSMALGTAVILLGVSLSVGLLRF